MANGKAAFAGLRAALNQWVKKIEQSKFVRRIQSEDKVIVSAAATGVLFLLLAVIQLLIIAFGKVHVYFDNVLLIVMDFAVTAVAAVVGLRQAAQLGKIHLPKLGDKFGEKRAKGGKKK